MTAQIVNISRNQHHLKINGEIAAYINCQDGAWFAQTAQPTKVAPFYYKITGEKVFMKRHEVMDEETLCQKLDLKAE